METRSSLRFYKVSKLNETSRPSLQMDEILGK